MLCQTKSLWILLLKGSCTHHFSLSPCHPPGSSLGWLQSLPMFIVTLPFSWWNTNLVTHTPSPQKNKTNQPTPPSSSITSHGFKLKSQSHNLQVPGDLVPFLALPSPPPSVIGLVARFLFLRKWPSLPLSSLLLKPLLTSVVFLFSP